MPGDGVEGGAVGRVSVESWPILRLVLTTSFLLLCKFSVCLYIIVLHLAVLTI